MYSEINSSSKKKKRPERSLQFQNLKVVTSELDFLLFFKHESLEGPLSPILDALSCW